MVDVVEEALDAVLMLTKNSVDSSNKKNALFISIFSSRVMNDYLTIIRRPATNIVSTEEYTSLPI